MVPEELKKRARDVRKRLERAIPAPRVELSFDSPWQLLVATILAAQSTDKTVNGVTPELFRRWPTPVALGAAPQEEVEEVVKRTGFFRNKARAIRGASAKIAEDFGGEVPRTMDGVTSLPGVARKTGNVVLGSAYGIASGFIVDTHVGRVARRLELTPETDPVEVETDLCALFPKKTWIAMAHRLVLHGRYVCIARKPDCARCPLNETCPSHEAPPRGRWAARADAERDRIPSAG
jgi:endonuclease-3